MSDKIVSFSLSERALRGMSAEAASSLAKELILDGQIESAWAALSARGAGMWTTLWKSLKAAQKDASWGGVPESEAQRADMSALGRLAGASFMRSGGWGGSGVEAISALPFLEQESPAFAQGAIEELGLSEVLGFAMREISDSNERGLHFGRCLRWAAAFAAFPELLGQCLLRDWETGVSGIGLSSHATDGNGLIGLCALNDPAPLAQAVLFLEQKGGLLGESLASYLASVEGRFPRTDCAVSCLEASIASRATRVAHWILSQAPGASAAQAAKQYNEKLDRREMVSRLPPHALPAREALNQQRVAYAEQLDLERALPRSSPAALKGARI